MATHADQIERFFKIDKFYPPLLEESDQVASDAPKASPEFIIKRLRELVPLLAFTKAMVVTEEQPRGH
ncbi:MAG: hypothetical protein EWM72_00539 [Nitrospira sp.]|nr:MAG: hypothetical protein EWM72_00539 [Nitrospira sp.]